MEGKRVLKFVSFGEVLFDVFNGVKKIGGAPLNLALRIKSFGYPVAMISAIGNDESGRELKDFIINEGLDVSGISTNDQLDTGMVQVFLDDRGAATYSIKYPAAWDRIEFNNKVQEILEHSDVLLFGSLSCRDEVSKKTLYSLLENDKIYKVFDVNLRPPHYKIDTIVALMKKANFIKFNDEELFSVAMSLGFHSSSISDTIRFIGEETQTEALCVTKGKDGAILFLNDKFYYHSGFSINVVDTVGAGDSFLAALITKILSGEKSQNALSFASVIGSMVAEKKGANPKIKQVDIDKFLIDHQDQILNKNQN